MSLNCLILTLCRLLPLLLTPILHLLPLPRILLCRKAGNINGNEHYHHTSDAKNKSRSLVLKAFDNEFHCGEKFDPLRHIVHSDFVKKTDNKYTSTGYILPLSGNLPAPPQRLNPTQRTQYQ